MGNYRKNKTADLSSLLFRRWSRLRHISFGIPMRPCCTTWDVDVKTAQKLLGHADFSVTMKIYTHLSAEKESAGIEKLNQHVTKCLGDSIRNKVKEG